MNDSSLPIILKAFLLLIVTLLILFFVNYNRIKENQSVKKVNDNTVPLSVIPDYSQLQNKDYELPDTIIAVIKRELEIYSNWKETLQVDELYNLIHETVFVKEVSANYINGRNLIVIVFSNSGGNFCGACCGVISFFEFQIVNEYWQLNRKCLAFYNGSDEGMPPNDISLERIGKSKYGIIVTNYFSGIGGHEIELTSVHIPLSNSISTVFDFESYEYYNDTPPEDTEYIEGNVSMKIIQSNKEFFDIETQPESSGSEIKHYKFDGNNYIEFSRK